MGQSCQHGAEKHLVETVPQTNKAVVRPRDALLACCSKNNYLMTTMSGSSILLAGVIQWLVYDLLLISQQDQTFGLKLVVYNCLDIVTLKTALSFVSGMLTQEPFHVNPGDYSE